jgi:putative ATPase
MKEKPLAYRARPENLDEIVGQSHLVGKNGVLRKMLTNGKIMSFILYGPPGSGKTTIATIVGLAYGLRTNTFNASTDKKAHLKEIIDGAKHYGVLLIVDEIHRMNKDIQDYLLPHVENGDVVMIGLTTENPYHSINPAIRSRAQVFKLMQIGQEEILKRLHQILHKFPKDVPKHLSEPMLSYIASSSNGDIRSAINQIELLSAVFFDGEFTYEDMLKTLGKPNLSLDKNSDHYYNILSAFQKSIRGSDVDASLHYLARLIMTEDLKSILRRMTVIAYEDVGFANPSIQTKMDACARACERVGFPEARIPLSLLTIDMALSPKSNSAEASIDQAIQDLEEGKTYKIPNHLINQANFEAKDAYLYPHSYEDALVYQQYLPKELLDRVYYKGVKGHKYEDALIQRNSLIKEVLRAKK